MFGGEIPSIESNYIVDILLLIANGSFQHSPLQHAPKLLNSVVSCSMDHIYNWPFPADAGANSDYTRCFNTTTVPVNLKETNFRAWKRWKRSIYILNHMRCTFFSLGKLPTKLANDQCSSIPKETQYNL